MSQPCPEQSASIVIVAVIIAIIVQIAAITLAIVTAAPAVVAIGQALDVTVAIAVFELGTAAPHPDDAVVGRDVRSAVRRLAVILARARRKRAHGGETTKLDPTPLHLRHCTP